MAGEMTDSGVPRVVAIAWGAHAAPQRGPSRGLSHEKIVKQAIEIADEHGLGAVTMQRVAESLGFTTMSLYRYVANKEELLLLMSGADWLLPPRRKSGDDWRENLRTWVAELQSMYRQHPWLLEVQRGPVSVLLPGTMEVVDRGMEAVRALELSEQEIISLVLVISSYVASFSNLERDLADQEDLEFGPDAMAELGEVITAERLPYAAPFFLAGNYAGGPVLEDESGVDTEYEFGLELLIEGLAARQAAGPRD
ncbi:TetR/AcrR family transcriptional regulator [Ornithinimicrobium cryptoxanthini]|uniref:TetR/AcrR family transcriptional regulator n=1 Tax=Ornithinimicrobium cryptoxanthini TaxID=2934161 RepID=A0ABY4YFS7_9MICO|nr:TetR/AcrR family transcriptional regulator [Ornithinimicrobium cryptoxanthini]USQ75469.1 TetR/AcrR family transcriptional regulator [Ornithinimicrobium cryptoxanthini]